MVYNREEVREKYKDLFEYSLSFIYVSDLKGNFLDANDIALAALGYKREEISNLSYLDIIDEDQFKDAVEIIQDIIKTGKQSKPGTYTLKRKDGDVVYVETYAIPMKKEGKIYAFLGIGTNITERKIAEMNLKASEERYRNLYDYTPFSIILIGSGGKILDCNPRTIELFGYDKEELVGKKFQSVSAIRPEDLPALLNLFKRMLSKERLHRIDLQLRKKDGSLIWVNMQASLVDIPENPIVQVIMHDISKRKEAERLLTEAVENLRDIDQIPKNSNLTSSKK
jgi:PAS domain S-box-containing protein